MHIVIAGGHGKIALRLERRLTARGDTVTGIVRNPQHTLDLRDAGADAVVCNLETAPVDAVVPLLDGADAVVFAAGAGPGSGAARKETVDRAAAILLADAAGKAGVRRFVVVSAMGVDDEPPAGTEPVFAAYLRAKAAADANIRARHNLDWTILRPGRLTDEPGTGLVTLAESTPHAEVPRDDVAAVLVAVLDTPATIGRTLDVVGGTTPIGQSVAEATHPGQ